MAGCLYELSYEAIERDTCGVKSHTMFSPCFSAAERQDRLHRVRRAMASRDLDACLLVCPENIYYLCELDHQGYFAYQLLIVPADGSPILVARAMERSTIRDRVPGVVHVGYPDAEGSPVAATLEALRGAGLAGARLGIELEESFLPYRIADQVMKELPDARWSDASGLVRELRMVQSAEELAQTRAAARVASKMMAAAIEVAGPGIAEHEVVAAIYDAMLRAGGTYPGFVPLVRTSLTLEHEHNSWGNGRLGERDRLFIEMAGCAARYHAPIGRLVYIGEAPREAYRMREVGNRALERAAETIRPGAPASEVYRAWQDAIDQAGLANCTRHHCGYLVGIGFPPSWVGGSGPPLGLRPGASFTLESGMVFHLMSWLLGTGLGDSFVSDTVLVTESGCEVLTQAPREVVVK
jgi:Xaa-Pro dipeptidase